MHVDGCQVVPLVLESQESFKTAFGLLTGGVIGD